jgi:demethoxyubiquinone hydroxylase (CLK1/Coq7/Cat5 family)
VISTTHRYIDYMHAHIHISHACIHTHITCMHTHIISHAGMLGPECAMRCTYEVETVVIEFYEAQVRITCTNMHMRIHTIILIYTHTH